MSKPPIGQKRCAHPGCTKTFPAQGRRTYCDEHRPGPGQVGGAARSRKSSPVASKTALLADLVAAAEELAEAKAQSIVEAATAEVARRALKMREQLIRSRAEVQKLKDKLELAAIEKEGV